MRFGSPTILLHDSLRDAARLRRELHQHLCGEIGQAARLLSTCFSEGHKVLIFGNGGSAADAQHMSAELVGRFADERDPLPAIALSVDSSAVTAIANDYGYDEVFARQVRALGGASDVAIAISTSGRSPNVLKAIEAARQRGMKVVGLSGGTQPPTGFASLCEVALTIPSNNVARIQECHITVLHLICELLEAERRGELSLSAESASPPKKALALEELVQLRARFRAQKRSVVWTNGCFDLLHPGHFHSLAAARRLGDVLVVGVNSDASVRSLKGEGRPIFPEAERVAMLSALEIVDYVLLFEEKTPEAVLARLQPDIHCKGGQYAAPDAPPMPEAKIVESYGGRVEFLSMLPGISTTSIIGKF